MGLFCLFQEGSAKMYRLISEGKAKVYVPKEEKVSRKLPVFYNPAMKMNRDIAVLFVRAWGKKDIQAALPLCGTGVRGVRFLLECKNFKTVSFNDLNEKAVRIVRKNIKHNKIKHTEVFQKDANIFLRESSGFDYIDIDPFGSPVRFLESTLERLSREGMLAVTATDTGALAGTFPQACQRRYWATPLKSHMMHETGLRILIRRVQLAGAMLDRALIPVFSYAKEHYMRVFFRAEKGKQKADALFGQHQYLLVCRHCLFQEITSANIKQCACGHAMDIAGPLWSGPLWDASLVEKMIKDKAAKDEELVRFLACIHRESQVPVPGFYDMHALARARKFPLVKKEIILEAIRAKGYKACGTHFLPTAIRTDMPFNEFLDILS